MRKPWWYPYAGLIVFLVALTLAALAYLTFSDPQPSTTYSGVEINGRMEVEKRTVADNMITREIVELD
jgi:hypothetical protein